MHILGRKVFSPGHGIQIAGDFFNLEGGLVVFYDICLTTQDHIGHSDI